ncbi:MAG: M48 family metalloprotease [Deltaproteobacteria bacterium]|nr:M48 family metalloprotease [Deltaproteobacteria bacterium]
MRPAVLGAAALLVAALLLGGCAGVSVPLPAAVQPAADIAVKTGAKAVRASRPISDSEEYYVGRAVGARILARYPLYRNPEVTRYVNEVGLTLARKSSRPHTYRGYHFAVLDTEEPNAFACPGGTILITRGLLKLCDNEDQLAAVLAHEVAHIVHKDGINSISQARWTEVLTTLGSEAARQYGGPAGQLVSLFEDSVEDVFKTIVVNGYSRSAEEKADREAINILRKAGYNPGALAAVLMKMQGKEGAGGIYRTHPPTQERLAKVQALAPATPPTGEELVRAERFKKLEF